MRRKLSQDEIAKAERNREIFNRALVVIMYHTKKTQAEVMAMLQDDNDPYWAKTENHN